MLSNQLAKWSEQFECHHNIPAIDNYKISGMLHMPKTTTLAVANYLSKVEPEDEHCEIFDELVELDMKTV